MAEQDNKAPAPGTQAAGTNVLVRTVVDYAGLAAWLIAFLIDWLLFHDTTTAALLKATWWLVGGSAAALALGLIVERRIAPLPLIGGLFGMVFGTLALVFHDPRFLKIKPTVINLILAGVMLGGTAMGKNPLKALLSSTLPLTPVGWRTLTIRYGIFFLAMAALNEAVWRTQPDALWVLFRFPGLQVLAVLFAATQVPMMMKDMKSVEAAADMEP